MTVQPTRRIDVWNVLWRVATGDALLVAALLGLALCLGILVVVPQTPAESASAGQWTAQVYARYGPAVGLMEAAGLFDVGRSPVFRVVLALLAFVLVVRGVERGEALWGKRARAEGREAGGRPWAEVLAMLATAGPLVLLAGLLTSAAWGWQAADLIAPPGGSVTVPGYGEIAVPASAPETWAVRAGLHAYQTGTVPEITVTATGEDGQPSDLLRRPDDDPTPELRIQLDDVQTPPTFAVPEVEWLVRIAPGPGAAVSADMPLVVQVFRLRTGDLVQEATFDGSSGVVEGDVTLHLTRAPYLHLAAVYDPGYWVKVGGLVVTGLALLGHAVWPTRRTRGEGRVGAGLRYAAGGLGLLACAAALRGLVLHGRLWDGALLQVGSSAGWIVAMIVHIVWRNREEPL